MTIVKLINLAKKYKHCKTTFKQTYQTLNSAVKQSFHVLTSIAIILLLIFPKQSLAYEDEDMPLTTDNRIKTYIYSPNEIYLMVLHFGFQSHIEFAPGEEIQTISLGDSYAWEITPLANRLFIKPMARNIRTNMTIITNKRTYQFDIVSEDAESHETKDLVYVIRFYYPKKAR
jgi:type IV secretion system protein VirB9